MAEFACWSSTEELLQICRAINGMTHESALSKPATIATLEYWLYHFVQDDFSGSDFAVNGPKAFFANMPLSKTLTMNLDVPETWLVEPVIAMYALILFILMHIVVHLTSHYFFYSHFCLA